MRGVERREREIRTASTQKYPDARGHRYRVVFSTGAHSQTFGTGSFYHPVEKQLWHRVIAGPGANVCSISTGSYHYLVPLMHRPFVTGSWL